METDRQARGRTGERLAREFLVEHGLEPIGANWQGRVGEIDLILREPLDRTTVFVEVRYRTSVSRGGALESVDAGKRARLRRAVLAWLQRHGDPDGPARIDVVAIEPVTGSPDSVPTESRRAGTTTARRPDRLTGRRGGHVIDWRISAIEDDG